VGQCFKAAHFIVIEVDLESITAARDGLLAGTTQRSEPLELSFESVSTRERLCPAAVCFREFLNQLSHDITIQTPLRLTRISIHDLKYSLKRRTRAHLSFGRFCTKCTCDVCLEAQKNRLGMRRGRQSLYFYTRKLYRRPSPLGARQEGNSGYVLVKSRGTV